jgi:ATP-dependent RNA helicase RhlE
MPFTSFNLNPKLLQAVGDLGFTTPTPIQKMAIPPLMQGHDVLGAAATGSGKTAAFLLPILHALMDKPRGKTRVLVLAAHTHIKAAAVYGGVGMEPQVRAFEHGVDIIVACPGRLLDHFQYPYARLASLEVLVLDEADRMLDMGFLPDVRRILKALPAKRQTMLFSATMPQPIVQLSKEILKAPVALNIERKSAPAAGIRHAVYPVPEELKKHLLLRLLKHPEPKSVLAFTRTKHRANRLADFLAKNSIACERIHGNRSQLQRTDALKGFKSGRYQVLVATDIAARGIDVEALDLVVNFDVPVIPEDYIHRAGRTARAELTGDAYTLVSPAEESDLRAIERCISQHIPRRKLEGFDYSHKPAEKFEVPIGDRIAAIRSRRSEERARSKARAEAKARRGTENTGRPAFLRGSRTPAPVQQQRAAAATHSSHLKPSAHSNEKPLQSTPHDQTNLRGGFYSKVARPTTPSHPSRRPYPSRPSQPNHTDHNQRRRRPPAPFRDSLKNRG